MCIRDREVEDIAFNLNDDEISGSIATEDGYYFIKCINKFNQELTDANKVKIVKKREKEAFNDEYDAFVADLSSSLNEKVWDELELKTDGTITTNSFFEVLDKYYPVSYTHLDCGLCQLSDCRSWKCYFKGKYRGESVSFKEPELSLIHI